MSAFDPVAMTPACDLLAETNVHFAESMEQAVADAEIIVIVTRWHEFENLPLLLRELDQSPFVFDGSRMLDENAVERYGGSDDDQSRSEGG